MILILILINALCLFFSMLILRRAIVVEKQLKHPSSEPFQYQPYRLCVIRLVDDWLTTDELFELSSDDFRQKLLRYHDPDDPYETLEQLLDWLSTQQEPQNVHMLKPVLKAFYQFQFTLNIHPNIFVGLLPSLMHPIQHHSNTNQESIELQLVHPGHTIDLKTMLPVNEGSIVKQPLGGIFLSGDTVLSKAKVICK